MFEILGHLLIFTVFLFTYLALQCDGALEYKPCDTQCEETCLSLSTGNECSSGSCMEGCYCPEGTYRYSKFLSHICFIMYSCISEHNKNVSIKIVLCIGQRTC